MSLDLLSFLDYSKGSGIVLLNMLYWCSSLVLSFFIICSGPYWYACCREWSVMVMLTDLVESMLVGHKLANSGGALQLLTALLGTLLCFSLGGLCPFNYSLTMHLVVTASLSVPFWGATVLSYFNFNWRSFLAKFMMKGNVWKSIGFQLLEITTVTFRSLTLCVRMSMNMFISLIFAKIFFSLSVGLLWLPSDFSGVMASVFAFIFAVGYYMMEWAVSLLQCWLFIALLIAYVDEGVLSVVDEYDFDALKKSDS